MLRSWQTKTSEIFDCETSRWETWTTSEKNRRSLAQEKWKGSRVSSNCFLRVNASVYWGEKGKARNYWWNFVLFRVWRERFTCYLTFCEQNWVSYALVYHFSWLRENPEKYSAMFINVCIMYVQEDVRIMQPPRLGGTPYELHYVCNVIGYVWNGSKNM